MKNKFLFGLVTIGIIVLTSCSKLPQAEIDAANKAIDEAKTAGAEMYLFNDFVALQDSMNFVMISIEAKKSKVLKNYSAAKKDLLGVTQLAQSVKEQTAKRIEELKIEIQTTITEVRALIETNNQLILEAPKGKEGTSALVAIKGEISIIETTINEANTMLEQNEYLAALDKAKAAKEKAVSINTELQNVIDKYKANVKNR